MTLSHDTPFTVMLVEDEEEILYGFEIMFNCAGIHNIIPVNDSRQVMRILGERHVSVVMLDLHMPHVSGMDIIKMMRDRYPQIPFIVVTAANQIETAVECMKLGALDYFVKPVEESRLLASVARAMEVHDLRYEVSTLKKNLLSNRLEHEGAFAEITTGNSDKMKRIFQYIEAISRTGQPVLVTGETGTGKELVSRAIHHVSGRSGKFIAVNVAGLDDQMFADTLFGHLKGAFTGAHQKRDGLIVQAAGGSIFLDEIGDLSIQSQVKLLRLIQNHEYFPLGSDIPKHTDARVIVATNRNFQEMIAANLFRQDLYYRFSAHHIHVPPLRERTEDIPLLVDRFLTDAAHMLNKNKPTPPRELYAYLDRYDFPGNVRQLQSMVFDAVARHGKGVLSMQSFLDVIGQRFERSKPSPSLKSMDEQALFNRDTGRPFTLHEAEEFLVKQALTLADGNQKLASSFLGISRQALNKKLSRRKEPLVPV
jgi:DNA-binding NtrC family response regulator